MNKIEIKILQKFIECVKELSNIDILRFIGVQSLEKQMNEAQYMKAKLLVDIHWEVSGIYKNQEEIKDFYLTKFSMTDNLNLIDLIKDNQVFKVKELCLFLKSEGTGKR